MAAEPAAGRDASRAKLEELSQNLWAGWDPFALKLFAEFGGDLWERVSHNPVALLKRIDPAVFAERLEDDDFAARLERVHARFESYAGSPTSGPGPVAYFSPEFGLEAYLPTYSGGLGVLAGDHLKAASDAGVAVVGVGLLYRGGYFVQDIDARGRQREHYPEIDVANLPLARVEADGEPVTVTLDLAARPCSIAVWRARVGRVDLLLLDTAVESNAAAERAVTDRLYSGDREHRLRQEIVLGIGGVRALDAAGYEPRVWHLNEGHAAFMALERYRDLVSGGFDRTEARQTVTASTVFTTHTPLRVAIDVFDRDLFARYFADFAGDFEDGLDEVLTLGMDTANPGEFNMAALAINLSAHINGVSRLHGDVSKGLFAHMWPQKPRSDVPIAAVTNGVHAPTWLGPEMADLRQEQGKAGEWRWLRSLADERLWAARNAARRRLIDYVRRKLHLQQPTWPDDLLDPDLLTICFARRFAQYKRATLMLSDPDRLRRLLTSGDHPVQIVVAGKAHPHDEGGKDLISELIEFGRDPEVRPRFVFVENYDIEAGRVLTQGADVWLNNPRRPLEACGTSGMKAAMNGGLNCSVLDGWWDECFDGRNGWAIGDRNVDDDPHEQDRRDAAAEYEVLEGEVIPLFYDRDEFGVPRRWLQVVRHSIESLAPRVDAARMMRDYVEGLYEPAARLEAR